jgi:hypothetical protein
MKRRYYALALILVAMAMLLTVSCIKQPGDKSSSSKLINSSVATDNFNYTGNDYKGNYVWGGAVNLAWNDLTENTIKAKIGLVTTDSLALETLHKLNNPVITKRDLDEASYYIKSGFGQQTVDKINHESRRKFPNKSFADLDLNLDEQDIIAYAYFLKEVKYKVPFEAYTLFFGNREVKGFRATKPSRDNIRILDYQDEDHFLVAIQLKNNRDKLFLAKGYPMDKPDGVIENLRDKMPRLETSIDKIGSPMAKEDVFRAPVLKVDYHRDYNEMMNKTLANKINNREYYIALMYENIKFDMDEIGAKVENEAVISMPTAGIENKPVQHKIMILDKPYWVIMKRSDSNNPYFILGVNNAEFMKIVN